MPDSVIKKDLQRLGVDCYQLITMKAPIIDITISHNKFQHLFSILTPAHIARLATKVYLICPK